MNLENNLYEAIQLVSSAFPNPHLWLGPASNALSLRVAELEQLLHALHQQLNLIHHSLSNTWIWSSLSLLN